MANFLLLKCPSETFQEIFSRQDAKCAKKIYFPKLGVLRVFARKISVS